MILVAITGVVCSGKSFVSKIIANLGYPLFSCDDEIHKILKQKNIIKKIKRIFPQVITDNNINKKTLAEIIFENQKSREDLETTLYPELFAKQDEFIEKYKRKKSKKLFFEVPLLYEKNLQSKYDFIITTYAPKTILIKRAHNRGISEKLFYNILSSQLSSEEKKKRANYVINTDCSEEQVKIRVMDILKEISDFI